MPDVKRFYQDRGLEVFQSYGTADLGMVAYESPARDGLILDEHVIVEIVRPGTGDPVADGEVGEIVVTVLTVTIRWSASRPATFPPSCPAPAPAGGRTGASAAGSVGRTRQPR